MKHSEIEKFYNKQVSIDLNSGESIKGVITGASWLRSEKVNINEDDPFKYFFKDNESNVEYVRRSNIKDIKLCDV